MPSSTQPNAPSQQTNNLRGKIRQQSPLGFLLRFSLSFAVVALAMGIRLLLEAWGGKGLSTYITFYPAVMSVALLVGFGPGLLATLLTGLVVCYWILSPVGQFGITSTIDLMGLVFFICMGLYMSLIAELYRRNRDKLSVIARDEAVRESEKQLALAVSATQVGMFDLNIAKGTVLWTQTHEAIFGYAPATTTTTTTTTTTEHNNSRWSDRVHPEDLPRVEEETRRCMQEHKPIEIQYRIIWPDESLHWVETKGVYQYDNDGTVSRMIGVVMDITERKLREIALRESEFFFKESQRVASIGSYKTDFIAGRWESSEILDTIFGIDSEYTRNIQGWLDLVHPDDRNTMDQYLREEVIGKRTYFSKEYRIVRKNDGETRWVCGLGEVRFDANGIFLSMIGTIQDITERKQAEEALREQDERLNIFIEHAPAALAMFDREMRYQSVSRRWLTDFGLKGRDLIGLSHYEVFPEISPSWKELHQRGLAGEVLREEADRFERADGSVQWVHWEIRPWHESDGNVGGIVIFSEDITNRKRMEGELQQSNAFNQSIIDSSNDCIKVINMDGRLQFMNLPGQRQLEINDFKPYSNLPYADFWKGSDNVCVNEVLQNATLGQKGSFQGYCPTAGGTPKWWDVSISPILGTNGKPERLLAVSRDITERKQAEEALRESEQRLRSLADSIPNLAWWADSDGYITWYNKRWYEYTGTTPVQMEGWGWQSVHNPDELPKVLERWQSSIATGDPFDMTFPLRGADGVYRLFLTRIIPLKDDAGRVQQWFGTNTDVSELEQRVADRTKELVATISHLHNEMRERELAEKKLLEETAVRLQATEALREKEQMLIQQSRQAAMGEMIGNIAHQWRQPLNSLGLVVQQLLLFYDLGHFDRGFLEKNVDISKNLIMHMSKTIDDFRNFFRPDKEKLEFRVTEVIASTLLLTEDSFNDKNIAVEVVAKDDPAIFGYRNEYGQVILNILNNARDALTDRGPEDPRVTITIGAEENRSVVTIADNAGGIPEEIMDKIFDPYFTTKGPQQGTGVGLFMSKSIIEKNMGGRLSALNTADGAEFRIEV